MIFNERSSTYEANLILKKYKKYKKELSKHFSDNIIKSLLLDEREGLHPVIHWNDVYENQPKDSVVFIWERQVDDFLYIDDSLLSAKKTVKYERKFLWYFATEEFMVVSKEKTQTYALAYSYPYQNKEQYGCDIDLYEKKNSK